MSNFALSIDQVELYEQFGVDLKAKEAWKGGQYKKEKHRCDMLGIKARIQDLYNQFNANKSNETFPAVVGSLRTEVGNSDKAFDLFSKVLTRYKPLG